MSPLEGSVHDIDYISYIYHACIGMKNRSPTQVVLHANEER